MELKEATGALVASVIPGGPAEKAKVEAGDVILRFNNQKVGQMRRLPRLVADTEVGMTVPIEVWRNNEKITLRAKIEELEDAATETAARTSGSEKGKESTMEVLGLKLSALTAKTRGKYSLEKDAKGVVVTGVDKKGPAAEKGIRPGDVIVEISKEEISGLADVKKKVAEAKKSGRKWVLLLIEGQGGLRFVTIRIAKG